MSTYAFRAVDVTGVPSRGEVDAQSKAQVTEQLRERGLIVLDVSEKNEAMRLESLFDRFRAIKMRDLAVFSRQFATLIASGMPMLRSLYTLEDQTEDERLSDAIAGVRQDVEAGSSLADAMGRRPQIFDNLFRAMVRSGESSGRLDEALDRIAYQIEKLDALKREIRSAVLYPAFVFAAAVVIMLAVVIFIVPIFAQAFKEAVADQPGESADLPSLTQLMIGISDFLKGFWFIWVPAAIGATIGSSNGRRRTGEGPGGTGSSSGSRYTLATSSARRRWHDGPAPSRGQSPPVCRCWSRSSSPAKPPATLSSRRQWRRCTPR